MSKAREQAKQRNEEAGEHAQTIPPADLLNFVTEQALLREALAQWPGQETMAGVLANTLVAIMNLLDHRKKSEKLAKDLVPLAPVIAETLIRSMDHIPWENGLTLLVRLMDAWLNQPEVLAPDTKDNGILPKEFAIVRDLRSETLPLFENLSAPSTGLRQPPPQLNLFGELPGFERRRKYAPLPLVLFDQSGEVSRTQGQGTPLTLRLWIEALLSVPLTSRDQAVRLAIPLRDLVAALWPNGWSGPARDGPRLRAALENLSRATIPWHRNGQPAGYWTAVTVRNYPTLRHPSSELVLDVELPPGTGPGPMVHRPTLRKWGIRNVAAYRLILGVCGLWNEYLTYKGKRLPPLVPEVRRDDAGYVLGTDGTILTTRGGKPQTHWNDRRAVQIGENRRNPALERLPWLSSEDLLVLGGPERDLYTKQNRRRTLMRVFTALDQMERDEDIVLTVRGSGRERSEGKIRRGDAVRIEPPDWWGKPGR